MMISSFTETRVRRLPTFRADALTLKIAVAIVFGLLFVTSSSIIHNSQRNLTEDIRRNEEKRSELLKDLSIERTLLSRYDAPHVLDDLLLQNGITMAHLSESQQFVLQEAPRSGLHHEAAPLSKPSAVASR